MVLIYQMNIQFDDNGDVERYNIFHVLILMRHANDEKIYLYDIMEIKKRNEQPFPVRRPYSVEEPISLLLIVNEFELFVKQDILIVQF